MDNRVLGRILSAAALSSALSSFRLNALHNGSPVVVKANSSLGLATPTANRVPKTRIPHNGACRISEYSSLKKRMRAMRRMRLMR
jgi:hypothetical protein